MQLSQKQKTFSEFVLSLSKFGLDNCLKSLVSDDPTTRNMVNGPKHC